MTAASDAVIAADLAAIRTGAAVAREEDRVLLEVTGADRASFLQGMLSNEVAKLAPGEGHRALLLNEQGRVVAELGVIVRAGEILLDVARRSAGRVCEALQRFVVADDVEIAPTGRCAVALRGPGVAAALGAVVPAPAVAGGAGTLAGLAPGSHVEVGLRGDSAIFVARDDEGFTAWVSGDAAAAELSSALAAGGARPVTAAALEADRVARAVAREGVDFDEGTLAPEVPSLGGAISYRKGCYLGQEVVERVAARGHVNWLVAGLRAPAGSGLPAVGAVVGRDGREVGRVSSVVRLPGDEGIAMLARIRREATEPGAPLRVDAEGGLVEAVPSGRG